jgi:hypothetical protein
MVENLAARFSQKHRFGAAISLLASVALLPQVARAGSATATLGVSLTIAAGCGVSGTPSGPSAQSGSGGPVTVNVRCDNAVPYRVETYRAVIVDTGSNGLNVTVVY